MKKNLSYKDQLIELAQIYDVKEIKEYLKRRKDLTTGQIELILRKQVELFIEKQITAEKIKQATIGTANALSGLGSLKGFFGMANGGAVRKGQPVVVGERANECLNLPCNSAIITLNSGLRCVIVDCESPSNTAGVSHVGPGMNQHGPFHLDAILPLW